MFETICLNGIVKDFFLEIGSVLLGPAYDSLEEVTVQKSKFSSFEV